MDQSPTRRLSDRATSTKDGGRARPPASLRWVTHAVADLEAATALFVDLLGGEVTGEGAEPDHQWVELAWGGPRGVRLVSPAGTWPSTASASGWAVVPAVSTISTRRRRTRGRRRGPPGDARLPARHSRRRRPVLLGDPARGQLPGCAWS